MAWSGGLKDILDWARRVHFVFWVAIPLLTGGASTGVWAAVAGIHIPFLWRISICLFAMGFAFLLFCGVASWWMKREAQEPAQVESLFSPFQIEVFSLAKELRSYLREKTSQKPAELPAPEVSQPGSPEYAQWMVDTTTQREGWRSKLRSGYKLRFADKVIRVASQAGEHGITNFLLDQLAPGIMTETDVEALISLLCQLAIRSWERD